MMGSKRYKKGVIDWKTVDILMQQITDMYNNDDKTVWNAEVEKGTVSMVKNGRGRGGHVVLMSKELMLYMHGHTKVSQENIAARLGCSAGTITKWAKMFGIHRWGINEADKVVEILVFSYV